MEVEFRRRRSFLYSPPCLSNLLVFPLSFKQVTVPLRVLPTFSKGAMIPLFRLCTAICVSHLRLFTLATRIKCCLRYRNTANTKILAAGTDCTTTRRITAEAA